MVKEEFRNISGYEGYYQVSNIGRVRSLERRVPFRNGFRHLKERILKQTKDSNGYNVVGLNKYGACSVFMVHQLVAIAFLNHKPCGHKVVVDHIDNNPLNNRLDNLQLISQRENSSKDKIGYTSRFIGVSKHRGKWRASIHFKGKMNHIGYFDSEYDAHLAYKNKLVNLKKSKNVKKIQQAD